MANYTTWRIMFDNRSLAKTIKEKGGEGKKRCSDQRTF